MLWDIIRDFFVHYIFGGFDSIGESYYAFIGQVLVNDSGVLENNQIGTIYGWFPIGKVAFDDFSSPLETYMTMGDYLSTIATIISLVAIVIVCILIIKKIFNICFNLFTGRSIF